MGLAFISALLLPTAAAFCSSAARPLGSRVPSIISMSLASQLEAAEEREAEIAKSLADGVSSIRGVFFDNVGKPLRSLVRLDFDEFELPGTVRDVLDAQSQGNAAQLIGELRDVINLLLLQERVIGVVMLGVAALVAVVGGLLVGDRTRAQIRPSLDNDNTLTFRTGLSAEEAALFDAGGAIERDDASRLAQYAEEAEDAAAEVARLARLAAEPTRRRVSISVGVWVELAFCILLDIGGMASLYYPAGEAFDLGYAFVYALFIELFFDWPTLALFALWEELLPFVDFIPSATISWVLVIVLGLRPATRNRAALFRGPVDTELFAPGTRPPLADRQSYMPTEDYLTEGSRPWEE